MIDNELVQKIRDLKEKNGYTLHEMSKMIDIQVATLARWLKTGHINRIYAKVIRDRLGMR